MDSPILFLAQFTLFTILTSTALVAIGFLIQPGTHRRYLQHSRWTYSQLLIKVGFALGMGAIGFTILICLVILFVTL